MQEKWICFYITIPFYLLVLFGIISIYIYLTISTTGEVRRNSIMIIFGIILFELGLVFALPEVQVSILAHLPLEFLWITAPILSIIGVILAWWKRFIQGWKTGKLIETLEIQETPKSAPSLNTLSLFSEMLQMQGIETLFNYSLKSIF